MEPIDTRAQRERFPITLLDEKLEVIRLQHTDDLWYDRADRNGGLRTRVVAWRRGPTEFHLNYHEVAEVPGSAIVRLRHQPFVVGTTADAWVDLPTLGHLDAALRAADKAAGPRPGDLRAQKHTTRHEGETPEGLILVGLTGSHAYGLAHQGFTDPATGQVYKPSDVDTRGVFAVPTVAVLALEPPVVLVEQRETDTCYDEVQRFLQLCLKANPERLEMLASTKTLTTPAGEAIVAMQRGFLSKQVIKTYGGYARQQLYRIERQQDRATKPAMHLIRLLLTGIGILRDGEVVPDMAEHRERLLGIRFGQVPLAEAFAWHRELEIAFNRVAEATKLPEWPDREAANRVLLTIRRERLDWGG